MRPDRPYEGLPLTREKAWSADPNDRPVGLWLWAGKAAGAPDATDDGSAAHAVIVGVPFDGAVIGRPGARGGPAAVRAAVGRLATYDPATDLDLAEWLRVCDAGDVEVVRGDAAETHRRLEAVAAAVARRSVPVIIGGDHSISYGSVRGVAAAHGTLGVLQFDAHHDVRELRDGRISSGTPFRRLLEDEPRRIDPARFVQVGIAPWRNSPVYTRFVLDQGIQIVSSGEVHARGIDVITGRALERVSPHGEPFFVSFDLDVLDAAHAPGVSAPTSGGLAVHQAAVAVRAAARHPACVGLDLVELAPMLDPSGRSAQAAAMLVLEFLGGLAERVRFQQGGRE
ncbi:MAG TPA: agmatinase family protein [Bacillota bacterium]